MALSSEPTYICSIRDARPILFSVGMHKTAANISAMVVPSGLLGYPQYRLEPKPVVLWAWSGNSYQWMQFDIYLCLILCSWNVIFYDHETFTKFASNFFILRKIACLFTYIWIYYYKINSMLTMKFFSLVFLMIVHLAVSKNVKLYCDTPGVCLVHSYFNPFNFFTTTFIYFSFL